MTADSLFNIYLDANIILLLGAGIWALSGFVLRRSPLGQAFSTQLQLIYGALVTISLAPLVLILFGAARQHGLIHPAYSVNISDFAVAQYLGGRIDMAPSRFESLLAARDLFTLQVTTLSSATGIAVAFALVVGVAFFGLRLCANAWRVIRLVRGSYGWRRCGRVDIRLSDRTLVPFSTRGLLRHYIVVPSGLLAQSDDFRIAVAHELQHMRQNDLLWEAVLEALRPVFFWNPTFGYWKREVEKLRELACDQQVLARRKSDLRTYCDCLLRVCHNSLRKDAYGQVLLLSVPFAQVDASRSSSRSARFLKFRVMSMIEGTPLQPGRWMRLVLFVPLAAAISFASIASQRAGDWSQDRLLLSAIVNLERLNQRNGLVGGN